MDDLNDDELRRMWLPLIRGNWSSLVLIPTDERTSSRDIAAAAIETARSHQLGSFKLFEAEGASVDHATRIADEIATAVTSGSRAVIAVDSPISHPGAIPLIMKSDAAVLLVRLRESEMKSIETVIGIAGRDRVLGCVAIHPGAAPGRITAAPDRES